MAPAYNFETIFNFSASAVTSMSFSHNQWWLLMGDADGTLRYLHSYDEIMKGQGTAPGCGGGGGGGCSQALIAW